MPAHFVLMPGEWPQAANYLCRPLLGTRANREPDMPWVAVATGVLDGRFDLVQRGHVPSAREFIQEAQNHLQSQSVTWQVTEKGGLFHQKPEVVRAVLMQQTPTPDPMDDLSSEQILNSAAMTEAAGTLHADQLVAIIPKRGWLLVRAGSPSDWTARKYMLDAAAGVFSRAGGQAISPYVFHWQAGQIVGYEVIEGTSGHMSLQQAQEEEWLL